MWARQGIKGFYGGLFANVVRALPEATIQFAWCVPVASGCVPDACEAV